MPEYLSPGVFIEEVPARLKAIEGVSTSTAGFVGAAARGPVPGLAGPFTPLAAETEAVLVTSFADFVRRFGAPTEDPASNGQYLGHAVRAFFDNGGRRCFVCRVVNQNPDTQADRATRASVRVGQGTVLRLAQTGRRGDRRLVLMSQRGIRSGAALTFLRRADNTNALVSPAVVTGTAAAPFALADGDAFGIRVNGGAAVDMTPISAGAAAVTLTFAGATVDISASLPLNLRLRVGDAAEPEQTISFEAADFTDSTKAEREEFRDVLNGDGRGIQVVLGPGPNTITLRTDQRGTGARLEILASTAIGPAFAVPTGVATGTGNVADVDHVTAQEIISLFAPDGFTIAATPAGQLRISSTAAGAGHTLQVADTVAGTAAKLGLPITVESGSGTATLSVDSYDVQAGTVQLNSPLPVDLDPSDHYVIVDGAAPNTQGAVFHARDPGAWGANLEVSIANSDGPAVPVRTAAASGENQVQVRSTASFYLGAIVEIDHGTPAQRTYAEVTAILPGNTLQLNPALTAGVGAGGSLRVIEITITLTDASTGVSETFSRLTWNPDARPEVRARHYATVINERSRLAYVQAPGAGAPALVPAGSEAADQASQPITANGFPVRPPTADSGSDGQPPRALDIIGTDGGPGARSGIQALQDIDDIRLIAAPGSTEAAIQNELISQCERLRYRFAILDGERDPAGASVVNAVLTHRNPYDTSFAGYYTPWVEITVGERRLLLPPSGFVAGICARADNERGVHKAPANEVVRNITGLRAYYSTGEQDLLNPRGVNAIRRFEGRGIRVWGARTLSSDPEFRYVNVRRFLIFLEASIDRGTQYVVFEPNSPETWGRVVDSVSAFLHTQWRSGALFGRRPEDAFFVRCDESTMSVDDIQNGRLICNIGVAIVRPAEFVIFRIEQITGFATQS